MSTIMDRHTGTTIAKAFATGTAFFFSGAFSVVSIMTIPAFLVAPKNIAADQFKTIYRIGYVSQPPGTLLSTLVHGFVAYNLYQRSDKSWTHWAAAGATLGTILPWTFGLMEPVSRQILWLAGGDSMEHIERNSASVVDRQRVPQLLKKWNALNIARGLLAFGAGSIGLYSLCIE